jgi:hypothetical protein
MSNISVDYDILNQKQTPAFYASSLATRPAFGFPGRIFIDTDTPSSGIYRDTGSAWVQVADPGAGTTGTLQQVTTNGNTTTLGIVVQGININDGAGTGTLNTGIGTAVLNANTTGTRNTAIGYNSLQANTTGFNNAAVGNSSLALNTTGQGNTAIGYASLFSSTTADNNTAIGSASLNQNTIGTNNTAIGSSSLSANTTGANNTAIGLNSLQNNTTGIDNTAVGLSSLGVNTTGQYNAAFGRSSLNANTTGNFNTAIGSQALANITTGSQNIAIGYNSGGGITTGSSNTIIGTSVTGLPAGLSQNIILADGVGNVRLFSDANGLIGINQAVGSTIGGQLDIHTAQTYALVLNGLTTNNAYTAFSNNSVGKWRIGNTYNAGANSFDIHNLGTSSTAITISSTNNVGIGNAIPDTQLTVSKSVDNGEFQALKLENIDTTPTTSTNVCILLGGYNTSIAKKNWARITASYLTDTTAMLSLSSRTGDNLADDLVIRGGNVLIGSTTDDTVNKLQVNGTTYTTGVAFPATPVLSANANTLDDYEEGQFTAVVAGSTTAGTATYADQNGRYTKIGNVVYFRIDLVWTGHTGTGQITITGLPFTVAQQYMSTGMVRFDKTITALNYLGGHYFYNSTMYIEQMPVGGGAPSGVAITSSGDMRISGFIIA